MALCFPSLEDCDPIIWLLFVRPQKRYILQDLLQLEGARFLFNDLLQHEEIKTRQILLIQHRRIQMKKI